MVALIADARQGFGLSMAHRLRAPRCVGNACLALLLACIATTVNAQAVRKIPVSVEHTGSDSVGEKVVFEFREGLRGSQGMRLVTESEGDARIAVHIVSQDENDRNPGTSSSMAIVLALDAIDIPHRGYLLRVSVHSCGSSRTQQCARSILANTDKAIERLRRDYPGHYARLR